MDIKVPDAEKKSIAVKENDEMYRMNRNVIWDGKEFKKNELVKFSDAKMLIELGYADDLKNDSPKYSESISDDQAGKESKGFFGLRD